MMPSNQKQQQTLSAASNTTNRIGRIPVPHDNDVLCGRGGSINSHYGNVRFRDWICTRKTQYNLTDSTREKAEIVKEVLNSVRATLPSGRFLQKQNDNYWIEIDDRKAMAKIGQALREGAPAMRAAYEKKAKRLTSSAHSPSPPRRQSKRKKAERARIDKCHVPIETVPIGTTRSSDRTTSSTPMTPATFLHGDNKQDYEEILNDQLYVTAADFNDIFTLQRNNSSFAESGMMQPSVGSDSNSFLSPMSSRPLIHFGDYRASLSEVANAIPLSQTVSSASKAKNVTPVLTSLSPPPFSPTGWDPLSFLPSNPTHHIANGHCLSPMIATKSPDRTKSEGRAFRLQQKQPVSVQREQSLLDISLGSFCDPFENDSNHSQQTFSLSASRLENVGSLQRCPRGQEVESSSKQDAISFSSLKSLPPTSLEEGKRSTL